MRRSHTHTEQRHSARTCLCICKRRVRVCMCMCVIAQVLMGDKVTVELSPYDLTKGRITYRFRPGDLAGAAPASAQQ